MGSSNTFATVASLTADDRLDGTIIPTVADPMDYSICTVGERSEEMVWTDFSDLFGASYTYQFRHFHAHRHGHRHR
jgi:hypothetical protein